MKKILVVDDEPQIRMLVRHTLAMHGYEIIEAGDGIEAIAAAETELPDLVILDVMMPGINGHDVRTRLRAMPGTAEIPVLFLSAAGTFEEQRQQMASDANTDYLAKPFSTADLAEHVGFMLDPDKREKFLEDRGMREARLSKIVEIMHRDRYSE